MQERQNNNFLELTLYWVPRNKHHSIAILTNQWTPTNDLLSWFQIENVSIPIKNLFFAPWLGLSLSEQVIPQFNYLIIKVEISIQEFELLGLDSSNNVIIRHHKGRKSFLLFVILDLESILLLGCVHSENENKDTSVNV